MPGMNGSGPLGQGPLTGGGRGPCGRGLARGSGWGRGLGFGMGFGMGAGMGFGRGYGLGRRGPLAMDPGQDSRAELEERLAGLEAECQALRERLKQQP